MIKRTVKALHPQCHLLGYLLLLLVVGAAGAIGVGNSAVKVVGSGTNTTKDIHSDIGKVNAGKFGWRELNSLFKAGIKINPEAKSCNFTIIDLIFVLI